MDKTKGQTVFAVFLMLLPCVYSVTVTCTTATEFGNTCLVSLGSSTAVITRIVQEVPGKDCRVDRDYGFLFYSAQMSYLWVQQGCGGTFSVTAPSSGSQWGQWTAWGGCSVDCGAGTQTRTRTCSSGTNSDCATGSSGATASRVCIVEDCTPILTASWNPWGNWGPCSVSCGSGVQSRIRTCSTNVNTDCAANSSPNREDRACNTQACSPTGTGTPSSANCGMASSAFGYRIVGGQQSGNCQYPWMVMLYNSRKGTSCGGSIIDATHILTAAHCVIVETYYSGIQTIRPRDVRIFSGSSTMPFRQYAGTIPGLVQRRASAIKIHERYNDQRVENDIAIITLSTPITFDSCHVPICLPTSQQTARGASACKVMGWGTTSNSRISRVSSQLLHTSVNVVADTTCSRLYASNFNRNTKLCVGGSGTGSCTGDSGGPLTCPSTNGRYYQYGIVSSGAQGQCGNLASMYTKVTSFLPWIKANTQ